MKTKNYIKAIYIKAMIVNTVSTVISNLSDTYVKIYMVGVTNLMFFFSKHVNIINNENMLYKK